MFLGNDERALQLAEPILQGRLTSSHFDYVGSYLLLPLLKCGDLAKADQLERQCRRSFRPQPCYYWNFGEIIKYNALRCKFDLALSMYAKCQKAIATYTDPLTRLHFALDAFGLFDILADRGRPHVSLRLPESVPAPAVPRAYRVADLRDWLYRQANELAERFDRRNGNDYFRSELTQRQSLKRRAVAPGA